jgi:polysaccharide biosynthesis protein PslF
MKIVVLSATFPPMRSGGSDYAFWLCRRLAAMGLEIEVVTSRINQVATDPTFQVFPLMKRWSWREMPRLLRFLRRSKPDLVNLHFQNEIYHNHPMVTLVPVCLKRMDPSLRIVTHLEFPGGMKLHQQPRTTRAVRRAVVRWLNAPEIDYHYGSVLSHSDTIIILSDTHRQVLEDALPGVGAKCVLIPPSPNLRLYQGSADEARQRGRELLRIPADQLLIAFYGYLYPSKGIETLIRAFALLASRRSGVRLLIIGGDNQVSLRMHNRPGYVDELRELAQREGVAEQITWTGYCPSENHLGSLYLHSADLCILPFDNGIHLNNSSFAVAASHGLAVVTTKGAVVETPFLDGENVVLCQPRDPQALVRAIEFILDDPNLKRKVEAGSLTLAKEWFSWEASLERTLKVFRNSRN